MMIRLNLLFWLQRRKDPVSVNDLLLRLIYVDFVSPATSQQSEVISGNYLANFNSGFFQVPSKYASVG